jgi:hypothetical protein
VLKSYEVIIENGQVRWLKEQPTVKLARAIITLLEEENITVKETPLFSDEEPELEDLGGSEPQVEMISRRRYDT